MSAGWKHAGLDEVGTALSPEWWQTWASDPDYGRRWHQVRQHLGITAFGVNANEADAGGELVVPHEEVSFGGQEELYVVLRGRARFTCAGDAVELGERELLYVRPEVERSAVALETPTILLMIGGVPGTFEPPDWSA